ncbi:hypothetical protein ROMU108268_11190 [Roseomonas mucosa]
MRLMAPLAAAVSWLLYWLVALVSTPSSGCSADAWRVA